MTKAIERGIYPLKASTTKPAGFKVDMKVRDQFGERRPIRKRFRPKDSSDEARDEALERARRYRDYVEENRDDIRWLRKKFKKKVPKSITMEELFGLPGPRSDRLRFGQYVERGLVRDVEDKLTIDPSTTEAGFLRRKIESTGAANVSQKLGVWTVIREWGGVHDKTLSQIDGTDVDEFVRYLETTPSRRGKPYSKATIRGYRMILISMIKRWAKDQRKMNPLDLVEPDKKPIRIKGEDRERKVPTDDEMTLLEKGLEERIERARTVKREKRFLPRRLLARYIHYVLKGTGMRPSEVLFLRKRHVSLADARITVEGGVVDKEEGATKAGKLRGEKRKGIRTVPIEHDVVEVIREWLVIRTRHGFPDSDILFCDRKGGFVTADSLRTHYKAACKRAGAETHITPYQMRHWRNDHLRRMKVPIEIRLKILGHMEDEMNLNYTDAKAEEVRDYFED